MPHIPCPRLQPPTALSPDSRRAVETTAQANASSVANWVVQDMESKPLTGHSLPKIDIPDRTLPKTDHRTTHRGAG